MNINAQNIVRNALIDDAWLGHDERLTHLDLERIADVAVDALRQAEVADR